MIHDFDQLNWLLGARGASTRASRRRATCVAVVEYDGASGVVEGSMAMPRSYPFSSNIRVLCESGVAEYGVLRRARRGRGATSARRTRRAGCGSSRVTASRRRSRSRAPTRGARRSRTSSTCVEQGRRAGAGHRRAGAPRARSSRSPPRARSRAAGRKRLCECSSGCSHAIDARRDDAVELLGRARRGSNSVNPSFAGVDRGHVIGGETRCNEILRERYEQAGLETHWVAPDPERREPRRRPPRLGRRPLARPERPRRHRAARRARRAGSNGSPWNAGDPRRAPLRASARRT